ncbi:MAG: MFS transporter [Geminocystis sp.]|nr:MFS transporter [Geminocystis sp.]HIK37182.1 MFS transporter [Geminocystis sp. M7585_C2015_104]MCS7148427.1 MFS transporter [Geminocystis sp.]MCX8078258.1 MFS transporter [Geminocystis sp.]MDW8115985.1 MFS transporter [Geminocystis sp.]
MKKNSLDRQFWFFSLGRLLLQFGSGFTLFYSSLYFVNELNFSPTSVGIVLASSSITGVLGRFLGGIWSDSAKWGRKKTILLSALVSAAADVVFILTNSYLLLLLGNLLIGLGIGLYWPPAEAIVVDLIPENKRNFAFALTRFSDNLGLGLGVAMGGYLISLTGDYRLLFIINAIFFVIFYLLVKFTIRETYCGVGGVERVNPWLGWQQALRDKKLWLFCFANILFTSYVSQIQSILPLYFANFVLDEAFSITSLSSIFTLHMAFATLWQLPVVKILNRFTPLQGLMLSSVTWAISFLLVWTTANVKTNALYWGVTSVILSSLALTLYNPAASAFIVDLAPVSFRGVYFAIHSECWAIGYLIGPPLGGWMLDLGYNHVHDFWLFLSLTAIPITFILYILHRKCSHSANR